MRNKKEDEQQKIREGWGSSASDSNTNFYLIGFVIILGLALGLYFYMNKPIAPQFFRLSDIQCVIARPGQAKR